MPRDLKLAGKKETFTVAVTYDTRELYGTVVGKRDLVIYGGDLAWNGLR